LNFMAVENAVDILRTASLETGQKQ
jgi:hypothetical protein